MSWSIYAVGKRDAVSKKIAADAAKNKCAEPEESARQALVTAIQAAISCNDPRDVIKVDAGGSCYDTNDNSSGTSVKIGVCNQQRFTLETLTNFVE